jgi:predicted permease
VRVDLAVLATTAGVSVVAGVLAGLVPAWRMATTAGRAAPEATRAVLTAGGGRAGRIMVAVEVAVSFVLLVGAGLLVHSFLRLASIDPGLDVDRLLAVRVALPESRYPDNARQIAFARSVLDDLRAMPDVEAAGLVSHLPFEADFWRYGTIVPGQPEHKVPIAFRLVSPGYFEAMGIPLVEGRRLTEADSSAPLRLVINETAAREMFPGTSAVGRRLDFSYCREPTCEIVGVVGDVRHLGLEESEEPAMYASFWQKPAPWMSEMAFLVRTTGHPAALIDGAKQRVWRHDGELPLLRVDTMSNILASTLAPRRFAMTMMAIFGGVAGVLALVGIQSVVTRAVAERREEIGLRMALGADAGDVLRWMTRRTMAPVVVGLAIGLGGALALSQVLQAQLVNLSAHDPPTIAAVAVVLALAALVAILVPARHAARVDYLEVLRG